ncbi:3175_t:CDS:2, partial [Cetraspora pellucida]
MSNLQLEILYDYESNFKCTLNEEFDELRLGSTINHNSSLMFWACFSWYRLGLIVPICGNVNSEVYAKLIVNYAIFAIRHLVFDEQDIFQQNSATPYKYWKVKEQEVERRLHNSLDKPTNIDDLEEKVIAAWYSIPSQYYYR